MKVHYRCKDGRSFRKWTLGELELLRALYPVTSNEALGAKLVRPWKSVISMAHRLGLKKSKQHLRVTNANNRRNKP